MKSFDVPQQYRSPLINAIKLERRSNDKLKKDFKPTIINLNNKLEILLSRHFGFCYGVENAIEIAFKAIKENPDKKIYLLSEMIHNPQVNADLISEGISFIMDTQGKMLIDWSEINADDIVIIPAFGTTLEIEKILNDKGIETKKYNTTCPFVEKVWNRSEKIGNDGFSIIVHGKPNHEETRATFSHSTDTAPTVVVKDMQQAIALSKYITENKSQEEFEIEFKGQFSYGFDINKDLEKIGVVNQTTMLASDTQGIAEYLKSVVMQHHKLDESTIKSHFADTRDTLCYATNDNQTAVQKMLEMPSDLAIVIGGYNSSNTSHLVELCEEKVPTFFINSEDCIKDDFSIEHYDFHNKMHKVTNDFLPNKDKIVVHITSGASCPDALVERVMLKLSRLLDLENALLDYGQSY